ncbi:hypothetical protein RTCIAT899_PB02075 (plasmid) [Rhizobium tropici CIAT 899]|nr:hypothetical protein RTCIAT899_PB02075 [Rhizobium tropici CIAT 899]
MSRQFRAVLISKLGVLSYRREYRLSLNVASDGNLVTDGSLPNLLLTIQDR